MPYTLKGFLYLSRFVTENPEIQKILGRQILCRKDGGLKLVNCNQ